MTFIGKRLWYAFISVFYNMFLEYIRNETIMNSVLQYIHIFLLGKTVNQASLCKCCGSLFPLLSFNV